jgi:hypothetical protein
VEVPGLRYFTVVCHYLKGPPSLNDSDQHNDNGNDQQDMNKITYRIAGHQPQEPQNYQYYSNGPQHVILLPDGTFTLPAAVSPTSRQ